MFEKPIPAQRSRPVACDHANFPLFKNANGSWCKKIKGKPRYFGSIAKDPTGEQAWKQFNQERPFWESGQNPRELARSMGMTTNALTLEEIATLWLEYRFSLTAAEDSDLRIDHRTYDLDAYAIKAMFKWSERGADPLLWPSVRWATLRKDIGKGVSPATKGQRINAIRDMFDWAVDAKKIARLPEWGESFSPVRMETKEEHRYDFQREYGERVFELSTARKILECVDAAVANAGLNKNNSSGYRGVSERAPGVYEAYIVRKRSGIRTKVHLGEFRTAKEAAEAYERAAEINGINVPKRMEIGTRLFRACTYLACNTGAYSKDIAELEFPDLNLELHKPWGYIETKRTKTAVLWQAAIWPETVERIVAYLKYRPEPDRTHRQYTPAWDKRVFLSSTGLPLNLDEQKYDASGKYRHTNRKDILKAACRKMLEDLGMKEKGVNFGAWRATFETLASGAIGISKDSLKRLDAANRTSARRIPGARNRYIHLPFEDLKPIGEAIRNKLWPEIGTVMKLVS